MDIFEAIHTRRSVRAYTEAPVSEADLAVLLRAGMAGPSAGDAQSYRFVVISDKKLLECIPAIHPYAGMAARAPLAILVCGDEASEKYPGFWVQDCAAAIQNIMLAARGLNIGSVWTGIHPDKQREEAFVKLCALPERIRPLGLVVLGHAKQVAATRETFDPQKIHVNKW